MKINFKILLSFLIILLVLSCSKNENIAGGAGQTGNSIRVIANNEQGEQLPNTKVTILSTIHWGDDNLVVDSGYTDASGNYESALPTGEYGMLISNDTISYFQIIEIVDSKNEVSFDKKLANPGKVSVQIPDDLGEGIFKACLKGTTECKEAKAGEVLLFSDVPYGKHEVVLFNSLDEKLLQIKIQVNANETILAPLGWNLLWSDDFESAELNAEIWNVAEGDGCPDLCGWGYDFIQVFENSSEVLNQVDGNLIISASSNDLDSGYKSASINTSGKKDFKYGRIDIRAKISSRTGAWSLFSLKNSNEAIWPEGGSIDMASVQGHQFYTGRAVVHQSIDGNYSFDIGNTDGALALASTFNLYTLIWDESMLRFFINDKEFFTKETSNSFQSEFYLNLELGVGGETNTPPISPISFDTEVIVDYVKVYQ